jgi:RHS repeat-associated protein
MSPFLFSQHRSGATQYLLFDGLGSTDRLTDGSAVVTDSYIYKAFGLLQASSGTTTNAFKYVGQLGYYYDNDLALYALRARLYDPLSGRFLSEDPLPLSAVDANLFSYVMNSPTVLVDPSGLQTRAQCEAQRTQGCNRCVLELNWALHGGDPNNRPLYQREFQQCVSAVDRRWRDCYRRAGLPAPPASTPTCPPGGGGLGGGGPQRPGGGGGAVRPRPGGHQDLIPPIIAPEEIGNIQVPPALRPQIPIPPGFGPCPPPGGGSAPSPISVGAALPALPALWPGAWQLPAWMRSPALIRLLQGLRFGALLTNPWVLVGTGIVVGAVAIWAAVRICPCYCTDAQGGVYFRGNIPRGSCILNPRCACRSPSSN